MICRLLIVMKSINNKRFSQKYSNNLPKINQMENCTELLIGVLCPPTLHTTHQGPVQLDNEDII